MMLRLRLALLRLAIIACGLAAALLSWPIPAWKRRAITLRNRLEGRR